MRGPLRKCPVCTAAIPARSYVCDACGKRLDARLPSKPVARQIRSVAIVAFPAVVLLILVGLLLLHMTGR